MSRTFGHGEVLPGRVEAIALHHMDEAAFWLPGHTSLVLGDSGPRLRGRRVRLCPGSWLQKGESQAELRASVLRALDARRAKWLLLTHGGPREAPA